MTRSLIIHFRFPLLFGSGIEMILTKCRRSVTSFTLTLEGLPTFGPAIVFVALRNCSNVDFQNSGNPYSGLCLHIYRPQVL